MKIPSRQEPEVNNFIFLLQLLISLRTLELKHRLDVNLDSMIHFTGNIYENRVPQLLLPFCHKQDFSFSRQIGSC